MVDCKDPVHSPEVVRGVSVGDQENSDGRIIFNRVDAIGAIGVVLTSMNTKRFKQRFAKHGQQNNPIAECRGFLTSNPHSLTPSGMIVLQRQSVVMS